MFVYVNTVTHHRLTSHVVTHNNGETAVYNTIWNIVTLEKHRTIVGLTLWNRFILHYVNEYVFTLIFLWSKILDLQDNLENLMKDVKKASTYPTLTLSYSTKNIELMSAFKRTFILSLILRTFLE